MAKPTKIKTLAVIREIPFNQLVLSQANVRTVKTGVSIEELSEDIAHRGLLQNLYVRPVIGADGEETDFYEVPAGGRHRDENRQPHVPGDGDHGLLKERRHARKSRRHGELRLHPHNPALRSPARRREPGRRRADFDQSFAPGLNMAGDKTKNSHCRRPVI
jgi:hypothetical protein